MKIVGTIVEYNPLHNGHIHHLNEIRKKANPDVLVAIMSGSITMRGDISVFNKFDKTSLALKALVDLVIELPSAFTIQNADVFCYYSVLYLNKLNVDSIYIGSELNDSSIYNKYLECMNSNEYNELLKGFLDSGYSYKESSLKALEKLNLAPLKSNDMLGLLYQKAINDINPNIKLITIQRTNDYFDNDTNSISALSIRNNQDNLNNRVPRYTYDLYLNKGFMNNDKMFPFFKLAILNNKNLKDIFLIKEGIENNLLKINKYSNYDIFINSLITKRYTKSYIQRVLLNVLFNIEATDMDLLKKIEINYIRVLGFNETGKRYLSSRKKDLIIYTNIKEGINPILDLEIRISKILDTIYNTNLISLEQKGPIIND